MMMRMIPPTAITTTTNGRMTTATAPATITTTTTDGMMTTMV